MVVPDETLKKAYPGQVEEIKKNSAPPLISAFWNTAPLYCLKREPCAHHSGMRFRGRPDESPHRAGDRKYQKPCWLSAARVWESPLYPRMFMSPDPASPFLPQRGPGAEPPEPVFLKLHPGSRRPGNRLPQGTLHVPGRPRIHPHCKKGTAGLCPSKNNALYLIYVLDTLLPS